MRRHTISRRSFLKSSAAFGAAWTEPWQALANEPGFSGIFPIVQTPYTEAGKLDFQTLAREAKVRYCIVSRWHHRRSRVSYPPQGRSHSGHRSRGRAARATKIRTS